MKLISGRIALLLAVLLAVASSRATAAPIVRVGYIVPQSRTAQPAAVANLGELMLSVQDWYGDQMSRYGFGHKTFALETEPDGVTPKVHVVSTAVSDATIRTDVWGQTLSAATGAGLPIWTAGQVWLLIPEAHLQSPNGSIAGGTALGASFGSGTDAGVAVLGSDMLFRASPTMLTNVTAYAGQTIPEIGPHPLVQGVSFPSFESSTLSSIASSAQGAAAHELGHAFGLGHDFRNDENFDGVLMGNGLRGWRGARLPGRFPGDDAQLSYAAALALNESRYFNSTDPAGSLTKPTLSIQTSGAVNPVNGLLEVSFTANDSNGLAAALLRRGGDTIGEMTLAGLSATTKFSTALYTPGQSQTFAISVYDTLGNRRDAEVSINVATGFNRAPQPSIDVNRATTALGETIQFTAAASTDPGGSIATTTVEWDLDGDGAFDTAPTTTKTLNQTFGEAGDYQVRARLTDTLGASSISTPLVVRIAEPADFDYDGIVDGEDLTTWISEFGRTTGATHSLGDADRDQDVDGADFLSWQQQLGSELSAARLLTGVPEPSGIVLAGTLLSGIASIHRRRR